MIDEVLKITQGQPFVVFILLLAVYAMNRTNADLISRLHAERTHRLDQLEDAIAKCEEDRKHLWERIAQKENA
jgi:hypothetical protein